MSNLQADINDCRKCSDLGFVSCGKTLKLYCGSDEIKVMIIGHSPATRTARSADVVLNMDIEKGHLHKYIKDYVLNPLGVEKENIYCTNLIKCFTVDLPEDIEKNVNGAISNMAKNCIEILEREIDTIKPKLIVSLSGTVFSFLSLCYMNKRMEIKQCFGKRFDIQIHGVYYPYVPVIHVPKSNAVRNHYLEEQTHRLRRIKEEGGGLY